MGVIVLIVPGMSDLGHVRAVSAAVRDVPGVRTVEVDLEKRALCVGGADLSLELLQRAVAVEGFDATSAPRVPGRKPA